MRIAKSPLELIGNTPIVKLSKVIPSDIKAEVWAKCEFMNLTGSIKDRMAYYILKEAEEKGELRKGMKVVIPTSGNAGIAIAAIANYLGYEVTVIIPGKLSNERIKLLKLLGAEVIEVYGGASKLYDALRYGYELVKKEPKKYYLIDQWKLETNVRAHYETTGKEIIEQLGRVDLFVAHIGTGGTLIGVAKRLKEVNPSVIIVGAEPAESPVTYEWFHRGVEGKARDHEIEGVGDGFVPEIIRRYKSLIDDFITVSSSEAINMAKELARKEGLLVGISSGANVVAAIKAYRKYRSRLNVKSKIVTVLPDYAARYFSTRLFNG